MMRIMPTAAVVFLPASRFDRIAVRSLILTGSSHPLVAVVMVAMAALFAALMLTSGLGIGGSMVRHALGMAATITMVVPR